MDVDAHRGRADLRGVRAARQAAETIADDGFLFKANLAWDVTDDSMLYGTYSQGYRHAGANAVPTTGKYAENPDYFTFDADTVDNYEIGYKGSRATCCTRSSAVLHRLAGSAAEHRHVRTGVSSPPSTASRRARRASRSSCPGRWASISATASATRMPTAN